MKYALAVQVMFYKAGVVVQVAHRDIQRRDENQEALLSVFLQFWILGDSADPRFALLS